MFNIKTFFLILNIILILIFTGNNTVFAQTNFKELEESALYSSELDIVNGVQWMEDNQYLGHPFWKANELFTGTVVFNGERFEGLTLKYELVKNNLILFKTVEGNTRVLMLNKDFVERFVLFEPGTKNKHSFLKTRLSGTAGIHYYQVVYQGKTEGYILHKKVVNNRVTKDYLGKYLYKPEIYIKSGSGVVKCNNKKSFLRTFTHHHNLLRKYIRKNRLTINGENPGDIAQVLSYYDSLIP